MRVAELVDLSDKLRQVGLHRIPDDTPIQPVILMNHEIAQTPDLAPGDLRLLGRNVRKQRLDTCSGGRE